MGKGKKKAVGEVVAQSESASAPAPSPGRSAATPVFNAEKEAAKARKAEAKAAAKREADSIVRAEKLSALTAKVDALTSNNIGIPVNALQDVVIMAAQEINGGNTEGSYLDYADVEPLAVRLTEEMLGTARKDLQKLDGSGYEGYEFIDEYDRLQTEVNDAVEESVKEMRDILIGLLNFKDIAKRPLSTDKKGRR